jgi:esterase/lipase superfamily enzyme
MREFDMKHTLLVVLVLLIGGCAGKGSVNLMPAPTLYNEVGVDPYKTYPAEHRVNTVELFYATTRAGRGGNDPQYGNDRTDTLRVGAARVLFGSKSTTFDDLAKASRTRTSAGWTKSTVESVSEIGALADASAKSTFSSQLEQALARTTTGEVTLYIHGFNVDFYAPVSRTGQIVHYMGRQQVGIAYCWPSSQQPLLYYADLQKAAADAQPLADFLTMLAEQPAVKQINLIGYSAGAPLLSKALYLRSRPLKGDPQAREKSKIGVVMFQSADADLKTFGEEEVKSYYPICQRVIVSVCRNDWALGLAVALHGKQRLGGDWADGLTRQQLKDMDNANRIEFINISHSDGWRPYLFDDHYFWYSNPWAISDLILAIQHDRSATDRGLASVPNGGFYYFPKDYPERLRRLMGNAH